MYMYKGVITTFSGHNWPVCRVCTNTFKSTTLEYASPMRPFSLVAVSVYVSLVHVRNDAMTQGGIYVREKELAVAQTEQGSSYIQHVCTLYV